MIKAVLNKTYYILANQHRADDYHRYLEQEKHIYFYLKSGIQHN